jgi:3-methyladenine DNA glycosylase AlkC
VEITRKGARSRAEIPKHILEQLNLGTLPTANLVEWLAVDPKLLLFHFLESCGRSEYYSAIAASIDALPKKSVNIVNAAIGKALWSFQDTKKDEGLLLLAIRHPSDIIRGWAAYAIAANPHTNLEKKLVLIEPLAADEHFSVRELAWMALRPHIASQLTWAIELLQNWVISENAKIRRFAVEVTRPRGVWCAHIAALKEAPELALPLLESLKQEPARYVQDSLGNWLNDASKTQPRFVKELCGRWRTEFSCPQTLYITQKALRTLQKKDKGGNNILDSTNKCNF